MKLIFITLCLCVIGITATAQTPTLSAGLDALTLNKGTIDVKVLTQIIVDKQKELKQEALKRFILKLFPETNYTTKFYIQNCLNTLFNEKNPQVIEKQILELTTNYALALGVAKVYANTAGKLADIKSAYDIYEVHSLKHRNELIASYQNYKLNGSYFDKLNSKLEKKNHKIDSVIAAIGKKKPKDAKAEYSSLRKLEEQRKDIEKEINRTKIKDDVVEHPVDSSKKTAIPFDILVDAVSSALSEIPELKKLGFFKEPIDYTSDTFYINLGANGKNSPDGKFQEALKALSKKVKDEITPYITNYDIIKEFCLSKKDDQAVSIQKDLIVKYASSIRDNVGLDKFPKIVNEVVNPGKALTNTLSDYKKHTTELEEYQKRVNQYTIGMNALLDYKTSHDNVQRQMKLIREQYVIYQTSDTLGSQPIETIDTNLIKTKPHFKEIKDLKTRFDIGTNQIPAIIGAFDKQVKDLDAVAKLPVPKDIMVKLPAISTAITNASFSFSDTLKKVDTVRDVVQQKLADATIGIVETDDFFDLYLKGIVKKIADVDSLKITTEITKINDADFNSYTSLMAKTYQVVNQFLTKNPTLKDIQYIDNEVIPQLIQYSITFNNPADKKVLAGRIEDFKLLSELLKIKAVSGIKGLDKYEPALVDLFAFIKNLDNLDQAETYQSMLNLLQDANTIVEQNLEDGKFKNVYILFSNAIKKYTIINTEKQYVQVDVVSFLVDLQQYFDKNNSNVLGLYLTLGLNQNSFFSDQILPGTTDHTKYIGFASEKIGLKIRFNSFNRVRGYENAIKSDVNLNKKAPFINEWYGIVYGSGLLYNIANTSTSNKFTYPHIGFGTGIRFYNSLDLNFVVGFPFVKNEPLKKYAFWGVGFDIPLGEYLEKIGGSKQ